MKTSILIASFLISSFAYCQVSNITATTNTGQSWTITTSGTYKSKTINLNLKLSPAAVGLPSNTAILLQQTRDSLSKATSDISLLKSIANDLLTRVRRIELDSVYWKKGTVGGKGTPEDPLYPLYPSTLFFNGTTPLTNDMILTVPRGFIAPVYGIYKDDRK